MAIDIRSPYLINWRPEGTANMALETELETFRQKLAELKEQEGKFALVHGQEIDVFSTYEDAIKEGYRRYGLSPFMVKQISSIQQVQYITRLSVPASAG